MSILDRILFPATIFLGAFLLFAVQPLIARFILPWFGGSTGVWTAAMLFFQVMLLGGYAYAHFSAVRLRPGVQAVAHLVLLAGACAILPIVPGDRWKPADAGDPTWRILSLLGASVGLPYLVLASTGPLLQAWIARRESGRAPWRLYALSNLGSLLALGAYPFVVEPMLNRKMQANWWSIGFAGYAILAAVCTIRSAGIPRVVRAAPEAGESWPTAWRRLCWPALPAVGVVMLLATTAKLCHDIAVAPLLWVLPLGVYLISLIVTFDSPRAYHRGIWFLVLPPAVAGVVGAMFFGDQLPIAAHLGIFSLALLAVCMICHGELYRLRPPGSGLTGFYLSMALGGALGGAFVALAAPLLFTSYFEFPLAILLCMAIALVALFADGTSKLHRGRPHLAWMGLIAMAMLLGYVLVGAHYNTPGTIVASRRGFYGSLAVIEQDGHDPALARLLLRHGSITHGVQFRDAALRNTAGSYYGATSGIGMTLADFRADRPRRIGVVGLGVGTLAVFGRAGDTLRFYELDPGVLALAKSHFSYLADSPATIEHTIGDARLSLEREPDQKFDVLVLDAFSGDAVPVHLLTREAFETYKRHLAPGGVLCVNISNQHADLRPVVLGAAATLKLFSRVVNDDQPRNNRRQFSSLWVILSGDMGSLRGVRHRPPPGDPPRPILWTDEHLSLFEVLR